MVQVIVPMSGMGDRFVKAGYTDPKPLIQVDGYPMIHHVVHMFPGATKFVFICNEEHIRTTNMRSVLESLVKDATVLCIPVHKYGPVAAVSAAYDYIDKTKPVIISYCDYSSYWAFYDFMALMTENQFDGCVVAYKGFHPHMLGTDNYAFIKETQPGSYQLAQIQEKKPFTDNKMEEWASNGTYYFRTGEIMGMYCDKLISSGQRVNNEFYVSMVYNLMVADNRRVAIFPIQHMCQWGTPYDLQVYQGWSNYFKDIIKPKVTIKNPPGTTTVLPMAGKGSRFSVKGYTTPKPLLDVNGYPMFHQAVDCLPASDKYAFVTLREHCVNYPEVEQVIEKHYPSSQIIQLDAVTEGQACTCYEAIKHLDPESPVLITACDNASYYSAAKYQPLLDDERNDVIVWSFTHSATGKIHPNMYSWLKVRNSGQIRKAYVKECPFDDPFNSHSIIGTFFFRKAKYYTEAYAKLIEKNIRSNGEFYVDNLLNECINLKQRVVNFTIDHYICWGIPEEYQTYEYWRSYFHKTVWHPYKIFNDCTFNPERSDLVIANNKMNTSVISHRPAAYIPHQGWGDLIESIPKICYYAQQYQVLFVLLRREAHEMMKWVFEHANIQNVVVLPIKPLHDEFVVMKKLQEQFNALFIPEGVYQEGCTERFGCKTYDWLIHSNLARTNYCLHAANYTHIYYFDYQLDLSIRANYFPYLKDISDSKRPLEEEYIVVHDDEGRGMKIDTSKLPTGLKTVQLNGLGNLIVDNLKYMIHAKEIHCIHSLYAILAYHYKLSHGLKAPVYVHLYSRTDRNTINDIAYFDYPKAGFNFIER